MKTYTKVLVLGNLAADPETRQTKSGRAVVNFPIATNRTSIDEGGKRSEVADFHRVVAWEGLAQICERYLVKGMPILLEGRLVNNSFEDKEGHRHYRTEIVADSLRMLNWKKGKSGKDEVSVESVGEEDDKVVELVS